MRHHRLGRVPAPVRASIRALQQRLELDDTFPAEVLAQAEELRRNPPPADRHADRTDVEFVTIDPPSSMDLDQAIHIERAGDGYLVRYAIADVGHWIEPGSPIDVEAHRRGQTLYAPGARIPLHPVALSEGVASLLDDGQPRPAVVFAHHLDARGEVLETGVERALVRSRAKLDYASVGADVEAGRAHPSIALLAEVGRLRLELERERGGISLNLPEQEIEERGDHWELVYRRLGAVEDWNAQISLLTGFQAAQRQLDAGVGILRTLPPADAESVSRLRRAAATIGVPWPDGESYPHFVRRLDPGNPRELAVLMQCTRLFRGAGYVAFTDGAPDEPPGHAALAAHYAHSTAPLRRLVDRYVLEICVAHAAGQPVPQWVVDALPTLPSTMAESGRHASAYERGVMDLAEALVLQRFRGQTLEGVLVDVNPRTGRGTVQIADPAVELAVRARKEHVGRRIVVRIDRVDVERGEVGLTRVS